MIGRLWKTGLKAGRADAYEVFARDISLPMFQNQKGFLGCVMSRDDEAGLVMTFWEDLEAVKALEASPSYKETVSKILAADLLTAEQTVTIAEVHLFDLANLAARRHEVR
jgi:heme-degrading monooxygenase HmoA